MNNKEINYFDQKLKSLEDLKINDNLTTSSSNFFKQIFSFNEINFELAISLYSNMMLVIISNNSKMGNFWLAEVEEESEEMLDDEEVSIDLNCILGERNNEFYQVVANMIVRKLLNCMKKTGIQIKNILVSLAFRSIDIDITNPVKDIVEVSTKTKQFIELITNNLESIF